MDNVTQVEVLGGGVRILKIQSILSENVGKKLGLHMNGDDSMAFGSAFIAANFSAAFRSKQKLFLTHGTNYDMLINIKEKKEIYNRDTNLTNSTNSTEFANSTDTDETNELPYCEQEIGNLTNITNFAIDCTRRISKQSKIFSMQNQFGINKKISFKYDGDVEIELFQKFRDEEPVLLMTYTTTGAREVLKKINTSTEIPRLVLNFHLDNKGLVDLKVI